MKYKVHLDVGWCKITPFSIISISICESYGSGCMDIFKFNMLKFSINLYIEKQEKMNEY